MQKKKKAKNVKTVRVLVVSCVALGSVIGENTFSFLLTSPLASPRCLVCVFPPLHDRWGCAITVTTKQKVRGSDVLQACHSQPRGCRKR